MRNVLVISLLLFPLNLFSQAGDLMISIDISDSEFITIAEKMESTYPVRFFYDPVWFEGERFSVKAEEQLLSEVLEDALGDLNISVYFDRDNNIILTKDYAIQPSIPETQLADLDLTGESGQGEDQPQPDESEEEIIIIGAKVSGHYNSHAVISGYIRDKNTGEPVIGATIFVEELEKGAIADAYGYYQVEVPTGMYHISFRFIGMYEVHKQVLIQSGGDLNIEMEEELIQLREVTVEANRDQNINSTQMGLNSLEIQTIKEIPSALGESDVVKAALMLPGVQTVGEGASGFNVRGGSTDQNLIMINHAPVFNSSHFFGFFSAFNPDVIKDFNLFKSGIPAQYGGRLSSVFDITTRNGNKKKYTGTGGISPVTAKVVIEGPIQKGKSSFLLGGRSTYSDWILRQLDDPEIANSKASFYDLHGKLNFEMGEKNTLDVSGYYSQDIFTLNSNTTYNYRNANGSVSWNHKYSNSLYQVTTGILSNYGYNISSFEDGYDSYDMDFSIGYKELKTHLTWFPGLNHKINSGISFIHYRINPGTIKPKGQESLVAPEILEKENALEGSVFVSDQFNIGRRLSIYAGLRFSGFLFMGPKTVYDYYDNAPRSESSIRDSLDYASWKVIERYGGPEYRVSARYRISKLSSVKISYNRMIQYLHMLSNTTAISPTDTWKLSDPNLRPQMGDQLALGFYQNTRFNNIEASVEIYYKKIRDIIDYKNGAELLLNETIETDLISGKGKAYGVELMVKKTAGRLNGWIGYTWSRIMLQVDGSFPEETINQGDYFPANYDKPHDLDLVSNYRFSRRLSFSNNVTYSTGRPVTFPVAKYSYKNATRLYYSKRNEYRIPDYFRWDVALNIEGNLKANKLFHSSWSVGVFNLTGRPNVYSIFFESSGGTVNGYKLSIFARQIYTLSYQFRF